VRNIFDILKFFIPRTDVQFYRPVGAELLFFVLRAIFGWNPVYYHFFVWIFFSFTIVLVFKITSKLTKSNRVSLIVSLYYSTSAVHYNSLSWLSNSAYIIGTVLFFLFIYLLLQAKSQTRLVVISYILGLLTFEFAIVLPGILFLGHKLKIFNIFNSKSLYLYLFIVSFAYCFIRFVAFPPDVSSYHFEFNKSIISTYRFFILFLLNWPETIKDNMLKFWLIRPSFVELFRANVNVWLLNTIIFFIVGIYSLVYILKTQLKKFIFLSLWAIGGLLPIVFVPSHIAPHYGSISLLPFLILIFYLLTKKLKSLFFYILMVTIIGITVQQL
jgi:hypothetical protein